MIKVSDQEIEITGADALELVNAQWSEKRDATLASLFDHQMQQIHSKMGVAEVTTDEPQIPPPSMARTKKKLF